jgi:AbrB family looped-hinge helix DNA binding protein
MAIATISSKGQITVPSSLRKKLGIKAHDRLMIWSTGNEIVISRIPNLLELQGCFGKAFPEEEEREGIEIAAAEHALGLEE